MTYSQLAVGQRFRLVGKRTEYIKTANRMGMQEVRTGKQRIIASPLCPVEIVG